MQGAKDDDKSLQRRGMMGNANRSQISAAVCFHQRSISLLWAAVSEEAHTYLVKNQRLFGMLSPKWGIYITPSKAQGTLRKRGRKECKSQRKGWSDGEYCLPGMTRLLSFLTSSSSDYLYKTCIRFSPPTLCHGAGSI